MKPTFAPLLLLALAVTVGVGKAQAPQVLLDIGTTPGAILDSDPGGFAQLGQQVLFAATTPIYGRELWSYDPTTGQASLLMDIFVGSESSGPSSLFAYQGFVYFRATTAGGSALWRTDGTTAGTQIFHPNIGGFGEATPFAGKLFFTGWTAATGSELFWTDGTFAGTSGIDIRPGSASSLASGLTVIGNELWFRADTPASGFEPWRTDGTPAGTVQIADVEPGPDDSFASQFHNLGGVVLFQAVSRIWSSDGTPAGTTSIGFGSDLTSIGPTAYYTNGGNLYSTDGTAANTHLVTTLTIPPAGYVQSLVPVGTGFFVNVTGGFFGSPTTYLSDGTAAGTVLLGITMAQVPLVFDGPTAYFQASDATNGAELWQSDGTLAGTTLLLDAVPGAASSAPRDLFRVDGTSELLFSATESTTGRELWSCDTSTGIGQLQANLADEIGSTQNSNASSLVDAAGTGYFVASDGQSRIWRTDGTAGGTVPVLPTGQVEFQYMQQLTTVGTRLFFVASHPTSGNEVWVTDGTVAGTQMFDTNLQGGSNPTVLTPAEDLLYFLSYNPVGARSLWRTDGTQQGLVSISAQVGIGAINGMIPLGRGLVFLLNSASLGVGNEPYYTDGTPQGTTLLGDLTPNGNSDIDSWATIGERCYFVLNDTTLMVTDGTPGGTTDFLAGVANRPTYVSRAFATRDRLYFLGTNGATGRELWCSDGTVAGTGMVADLGTGSQGISIYNYHAMGDLLLFQATVNGIPGIWRTDGSAANTYSLTDFQTSELLVTGEREAWFVGHDPAYGFELWRTDGTVAGTGMHADLMPGDESSWPDDFALSGGRLLFSAEHPQLGVEPWVIQLHATSQDVGYGCTPTTTIPPLLWSDDPVLGQTMQIRVGRGPDPGISALLFSNYTDQMWPLGTGFCDYFVDPGLVLFDFTVMPGGIGSHQLAIPAAATFLNQRFRLQALTFPAAGLLQAELSNGLTLTLGN